MVGVVVGSPFFAVETIFLMPWYLHDASYSAIIAFLSMGSDNFGPDGLKQAFFNKSTWWASDVTFNVVLFLLGIMLSCIDE